MKVFFDKDFVILPYGTEYIYYFGNINKAIKLSYTNMYYLRCITEHGVGKEIDQEFINKNGIEEKKLNNFIKYLCENKILFCSNQELKENDFGYIYEKILRERKPKTAYIHVTQKCNLNCAYCYNKHNLNKDIKELSAEQWKKVIEKLCNEGVCEFVFTGGEPLMRRDLLDIISYADGKKTLLTNGSLIEESKYEVLRAFTNIIISLDSLDNQENDMNRANSLSFDISKRIGQLPEDIKKKIKVRSVVTKNNYSSIEDTRRYFEEKIGIEHITSMCLPNSKYELEEFVPLEDMKRANFSLRDMNICGAGTEVVAINANGDIYPCQSLIKNKFKTGNILDEEWNGSEESIISKADLCQGILNIEQCKKCIYKYICGGGCKAITYNIYNRISQTNNFMCEYYKNESIMKIKKLFS